MVNGKLAENDCDFNLINMVGSENNNITRKGKVCILNIQAQFTSDVTSGATIGTVSPKPITSKDITIVVNYNGTLCYYELVLDKSGNLRVWATTNEHLKANRWIVGLITYICN